MNRNSFHGVSFRVPEIGGPGEKSFAGRTVYPPIDNLTLRDSSASHSVPKVLNSLASSGSHEIGLSQWRAARRTSHGFGVTRSGFYMAVGGSYESLTRADARC